MPGNSGKEREKKRWSERGGLLCACLKDRERALDPFSKLIVVFLMAWKQIPKKR